MIATPHAPTLVLDKARKAVDVAMARSAAPMAEVGDGYFVDGGLWQTLPTGV